MLCNLCPEDDPTQYIGESSRNLYTRLKEHQTKYKAGKDSFMLEHQQEKHGGETADFSAKVTHTFRDCLTRQVSEAVHIRRSNTKVLNSKSEWHQPSLFSVQSEVIRGQNFARIASKQMVSNPTTINIIQQKVKILRLNIFV